MGFRWGVPLVLAASLNLAAPICDAPARAQVGGRGAVSQGQAATNGDWSAAAAPAPAAFEIGLTPDSDLLLLPAARRPGPRPLVTAATRVGAPPRTVADVVLDPGALRAALPALIRADVALTRPGPRPDAWPDRLLDWEVEVPLFNLKGRAWLRQSPDGAVLALVDGAFAPGIIRLRIAPTDATNGSQAILTCSLQVEARSSNWIFRTVARHDPWAETAMSAAMAWVIARAVALRAEAGSGARPARPRDAVQPPSAQALDGSRLAGKELAALRRAGVVAAVQRTRGGRLAWTSVAVPMPGPPDEVTARLFSPESWSVFPGLKSVTRRSPPAASARPQCAAATSQVVVEDNVALVDLDAVWTLDPTWPGRATAVEGDTRGAVLAWQVFPGDAPGTALAILSMHPRLDAAGFVERRLVTAEPLLEHALASALAYVDAAATADDLARRRARDPAPTAPR